MSTEAATKVELVLARASGLTLAANHIHKMAVEVVAVVATTTMKLEIASSRERNVMRWSSSS